jgi:adenosylmethionine-8-amino-7-oxononanoate aminotransferase
MEKEQQGAHYLRQLALDHVWIPLRPWNVVTAPGGFSIFTEGKGCRLTDIAGKTYLDYWSGIMLSNVGYGRKEIADAAYEQMLKLHFPPTHELTVPKIKLAKKLAEITPGDLSRVLFGNSGTESIESALKIARKYQRLSGSTGRYKFIGGNNYHGSTFGSMALGWRGPNFTWEDFEPLLPRVIHVPRPYCSMCELGLQYPGCDLQCAKQVETVIKSEIPETIAAFVDVPVPFVGFIPPPEYWPLVRSMCDKYGILLILDEVQSGFGRTGKMFAIEHWNVAPDIMVIAKALAGGYAPISAAIVTKKVAQKFEGGPEEVLRHSYTFEGHPVACATALANIEIMEREKLVENSKVMGNYLYEQLQSLAKHRIVGEVRGGLGLMCNVELVKDKETQTQFSPEENARVRKMLKTKLMEAGLFGMFTNPIPIMPALIISQDEIDEIVSKLDSVIGEIESELLHTY